jgi:hypothetical protein
MRTLINTKAHHAGTLFKYIRADTTDYYNDKVRPILERINAQESAIECETLANIYLDGEDATVEAGLSPEMNASIASFDEIEPEPKPKPPSGSSTTQHPFDTSTLTLDDYIGDQTDNSKLSYHIQMLLSTVANITNGDLYAVKQRSNGVLVINTMDRETLARKLHKRSARIKTKDEKPKVYNYDRFLDLPEVNGQFRMYRDVKFYAPSPDVLNIFKSYPLEPADQINMSYIEPLLWHIKNIIAGANQQYYDTVLNWVSLIFQRHDVHNEFALVLLSHIEGTGKNTFINFVSSILGKDYSAGDVSSMSHILDNGARSVIGYKKLVVCNELQSFENSRAQWNTMKDRIDGYHYRLRDCYDRAPVSLENVNNYAFLSNNYDAVKLGQSDRRYFVLDVSAAKAGDSKYFDRLHRSLNDECRRHFLAFLLSRDISKYDYHHPPMTELKRELQQAQRAHYEDFVLQYETDEIQREGGIVSSVLFDDYIRYCDCNNIDRTMRIKTPNGFAQKIRHLVRKVEVKRNRKAQTVYFLLSDDKRKRKLALESKAKAFHIRKMQMRAFNGFKDYAA